MSPSASLLLSSSESKNHLHGMQLFATVVTLNAANGVAFIDLMGIASILPTIALHFANPFIDWAPTLQLVGATIGQCLFGYLSDVFSRTRMLQVALVIYTLASLLCGSSAYFGHRSAPLFCAFRIFSGVATGSISNLVNIAQSDIIAKERRGNFQGIQGFSVAAGSIVGMMCGAVFATDAGRWEWLYWLQAGLGAFVLVLVCLFVPANVEAPTKRKIWTAVKTIDCWGIMTGIGFIVPALVLLCKGGLWGIKSPATIALIVFTILFFLAFVMLGFKERPGVRPMIPFHLFRNPTIAVVYVQNILLGAVYYSFTYFLPLLFQVVRQLPAIHAAALFIPYMCMHGVWSAASGYLVTILDKTVNKREKGSYILILGFGFAMWTIGMIILTVYGRHVQCPIGLLVAMEILVGLGTGSTFQNSVNAIRNQVEAKDSAVALSARNVLRFFGGALGVAISSTIVQSRLRTDLPKRLGSIADSAFSRPVMDAYSPADQLRVRSAYADAISYVFFASMVMTAVCFVCCFGLKYDKRMKEGGNSLEDVATMSDVSRPESTFSEPGIKGFF